MNRSEALARLAGARVAHLATTRPDGEPHVVPITFAVTARSIATMVDHKPKTTDRLQRLVNIEAQPRVSVLVDHYSEDWAELWWVRVDGDAQVHHHGEAWVEAREALSGKYQQYLERPPAGAAVMISVDQVSYWAGTP